MPRENWRAQRESQGMPDWIEPDKEHLYPGCGRGFTCIDWVPDPEAEPDTVVITPGEERYGIGWREGDPIPKKREVKPFLNPNNVG